MRLSYRLFLVPLVLAAVPAMAQETEDARPGPQACGQEAETAVYGELRVGATVVLQRHRWVDGDPNWDPNMGRYLGRVATVTRLSGVDEAGCPGVRVDLDEGRYFWRARDVGQGTESPRSASTGEAPGVDGGIPRACGQSDAAARYGSLAIGSEVVLGRHSPIDGDDNWAPDMGQFVGRRARIQALAGTDEAGCPGVHVDLDGGRWFWRIRDFAQAGAGSGSGEGNAYRSTVQSDHGRPAGMGLAAAEGGLPQACGMTEANVDYGQLAVGTAVVLGRHRAVDGEENWAPEMEPFVGRSTQVTELIGVDDQGCALVHVQADNGEWFWRVRDLRLERP